MANYCGFSRTNYFRVTDEEKYKKLFSGLRACDCDGVEDFSEERDGVMWHGFGAYGSIEYPRPVDPLGYVDDPDCDTEDCFDDFVDELKKILPDDEAFILTEVGYEKLRYLVGWSMVVVKDKPTILIDLPGSALEAARGLLGDDKWTTRMDY